MKTRAALWRYQGINYSYMQESCNWWLKPSECVYIQTKNRRWIRNLISLAMERMSDCSEKLDTSPQSFEIRQKRRIAFCYLFHVGMLYRFARGNSSDNPCHDHPVFSERNVRKWFIQPDHEDACCSLTISGIRLFVHAEVWRLMSALKTLILIGPDMQISPSNFSVFSASLDLKSWCKVYWMNWARRNMSLPLV